jgi:hypothetical protein
VLKIDCCVEQTWDVLFEAAVSGNHPLSPGFGKDNQVLLWLVAKSA